MADEKCADLAPFSGSHLYHALFRDSRKVASSVLNRYPSYLPPEFPFFSVFKQ
jgi:hypothetical protein